MPVRFKIIKPTLSSSCKKKFSSPKQMFRTQGVLEEQPIGQYSRNTSMVFKILSLRMQPCFPESVRKKKKTKKQKTKNTAESQCSKTALSLSCGPIPRKTVAPFPDSWHSQLLSSGILLQISTHSHSPHHTDPDPRINRISRNSYSITIASFLTFQLLMNASAWHESSMCRTQTCKTI